MRGEVRVEKVGDRIHATIPYANGEGPTFAKRVPGARWSKSTKTWTYPLEWNVCVRLREVFGQSLRIGMDLATWATTEKQRVAALSALAVQGTAELHNLPTLAPRLAAAMASRTYQQVGVAFATQALRTLIGDQPRLGKTLQALGAVVERGVYGNHLIFSPSTAIETVWVPAINRWLGSLGEAVPVVGTREQREAAFQKLGEVGEERHRFFICNIEMAQIRMGKNPVTKKSTGDRLPPEWPELFRNPWHTIIVDESHFALIGQNNPKTMTATRFGMVQLSKLNPAAMLLALSGTPMRGKRHRLWGTLNWLRPDVYTSYWRWVETYFEVEQGDYGREIGEMKSNMVAAFDREMSTIMLRRTTAEVRPEIPPMQRGGDPLDPSDPNSPIGVWIPMDPQQARSYNKVFAEGLVDDMPVNGVLAEFTRAKQLANQTMKAVKGDLTPCLPSNKFDWIVQFLAERGIAAEDPYGTVKVVIGSQFTDTLKLFELELGKLGIDTLLLTGDTPKSRRPAMVDSFQSQDGPRVCLLQTKTGGVAITLDAADEMIIVDETWINDDQEQLERRIEDTGTQPKPKMVWYLHSLGTVEEGIAHITTKQGRDIGWLLDGRRTAAQLAAVLRGEEAAA